MLIKICGIMDPETALFTAQNGANYIGMILTPGFRRSVTMAQAQEIATAAKNGKAEPVAVFVGATAEEIERVCHSLGVHLVQAYQLEGTLPSQLKRFIVRGNCKTPRPGKIDDFEPVCQGRECGPCPAAEGILQRVDEAAGWQNGSKGRFCRGGEFCNCLVNELNVDCTDGDFLLMEGCKPGSGEMIDEKTFIPPTTRPWFLAGGLHPSNVKEMIQRYHPDGVDVSSGVEEGQEKSRALIVQFIAEVESCE